MEKLNYYGVKTLCDSSHFNVDFNSIIAQLHKEYGAAKSNSDFSKRFPFHVVCQLIRERLVMHTK